jgi:hypothetical protein
VRLFCSMSLCQDHLACWRGVSPDYLAAVSRIDRAGADRVATRGKSAPLRMATIVPSRSDGIVKVPWL